MNWIIGLQKAIDYIENHITEPIDYETIAACAYSSSFHFQKVFSIICGYTIGDYIRLRRLTLAGSELTGGCNKVIDVALKYGYDTPESFSRAFRRFHGITPMQAKNGATVKSFSRLSVKLILSGGNTMDYRIESKEAFEVILKKKQFPKQYEVTTNEISKFWEECTTDGTISRLAEYIPEKGVFGKNIIGISFNAMEASEFPYGIGTEYDGRNLGNDEFIIEKIPKHTYLVFKCIGKMPEAFQRVYKYICTEFLPTSDYQPCGIEIESYPSADIQNPDYTCEIWIAVEKKN